MSEYVIITDSTSDLPQEYAAKLDLAIIPYVFQMEGREYFNYLDHREFPATDFYSALKEGKTASTSLVTEERYTQFFEPYLQQGKDILYMCLSTGLSGSYHQCKLAADALAEKYPGRKLEMIDSLCASMGQGLLAYYACKARDEGQSVTEAAQYIRDLIPHICHLVCVDDLNHLRRGGRVTGAAAFVGTMLSIKPILHVDDEGRLIPFAKVRGSNGALEYIVERMQKVTDGSSQIVFISHGDAPERAQKLADLIKSNLGLNSFVLSHIGPVVGAHAGPGTLALFFKGSKR